MLYLGPGPITAWRIILRLQPGIECSNLQLCSVLILQVLRRVQWENIPRAAEAVQPSTDQLETVDISNGPRKAVIKIFSDKDYEDVSFDMANTTHGFKLHHLNVRLTEETAGLAAGAQAVSVFVNDEVNEAVLQRLAEVGVKCVALRCAGCDSQHRFT